MIYLDNNASTPLRPEVQEVLSSALRDIYANASNGLHLPGGHANELFIQARNQLAKAFDRHASEVFLTSGATESIAIAMYGFGLSDPARPNLVVSRVEHEAVHSSARAVARITGGTVRVVDVDRNGQLEINQLQELVDETVSVVAVMAANNETGVIQEHSEIATIAKARGAKLFVDLTQAVGKVELHPSWLEADSFCLSGHKIGAPKGVGLLVLSRAAQERFFKLIPGGGQQREVRGGTLNVPYALALATAVNLAIASLPTFRESTAELGRQLTGKLRTSNLDVEIAGAHSLRIPNTYMLRIPGLDADLLLSQLPGIALSLASACHFGDDRPSHVLTALGYSRAEAAEFFRVSAGHQNDPIEGVRAGELIAATASRLLGAQKA